jgi:hypothetical protein
MPECDTANPQVICRDCGQTMAVIQQPTFNGDFISLITCWQRSCALYGVTLSVDQYDHLTEDQLEAYRQMNRVSRTKYLKRDGE